ncbi:MucB/RseB C-terminal domain-containing protein [Endozoicomonas sp. SESOKO1]|uniref:MucB/RseB C-terminal domain-containing protein n=1 Tax=Endozoicomonas sp. SESOKO1 TaxID=2828742 RepID=UPI002147F1AA|nr:MucB/RseB C-terminal domain-containing protein [Endozoicomonas sp. SESOKO1]
MKKMQWISRALLAFCFFVSGFLYAETSSDAGYLLERMASSSRSLSFQGEFVYQQGAQLQTLSVIHQAEDQEISEKERITFLDGAPREVIRSGNELFFSSYNEGVTQFQHGSLMPVINKFQSGISERFYDLKIVGIDRVAGREAVLLLVLPKDRFRYGYQLWLDRKSSLLLKSVLVDDQGKIIERLQFTSLRIGQLSDDVLALLDRKPSSVDQTIHLRSNPAKEDLEKPRVPPEWETGWLPDGFVLENSSIRPSPVSQHDVDALVFSDGIATFSVFVEQDDTRVLSQASEQIGALSAVSKIYREGNQYFHVTVVGDIPLSTAERVAVSVRPVKIQP